jgi:putative endonuclease
MTNQKILGNRGEALAKKYLTASGYRIITGNHKIGRAEIDLIAQKDKQLIFIEIKTRLKTADSIFENPVSPRQTKILKRAINEYCFKNHASSNTTRLDLIFILVDLKTRKADLKHYRDIF